MPVLQLQCNLAKEINQPRLFSHQSIEDRIDKVLGGEIAHNFEDTEFLNNLDMQQ